MTLILEDTNIWTKGPMDLYLDNEPVHVYVPKSNVQNTYKNLQSRLSKQGHLPIGIDHLADNILEANPILRKLDLHNVGYVSEIEYADDTIHIVEAELTNPLIKELYNKGELDMVSIVADSTTSECPQDYDYIVDTTDITRIDIVEKGACPTCNIPKPTGDSSVVYARYSITNKEENDMADDAITMEEIQEAIKTGVNDAIAPLTERLDAVDESIKTIEEKLEELEKEPEDGEGKEDGKDGKDSKEIEAMKAEITTLKAQRAEAQVDSFIAQGKILPAQKEAAVKLCASDSAKFDELYKEAPAIVDLNHKQGLQAGDSSGESDPEPTEDEQLINELNMIYGDD